MVSSLHRALDCGHYKQIHALIQVHKSKINSSDIHGRTLLMKCALLSNIKQGVALARKLLYAGADKMCVDSEGRNALFYAALSDNAAMVRLLLANLDIDLNTKDTCGCTILHVCCQNGLYKMCKILVPYYPKYRISIDVTNSCGKTPLHVACAQGFYDIARLLVYEGGASLQQRDNREFKNAREWLEDSLVLTPDIDPFPAMTEVRHKWATYTINRTENRRTKPEVDCNSGKCLNITAPAKLQSKIHAKSRRNSAISVSPTVPLSCQVRSQSAVDRSVQPFSGDEFKTRAKTTIGNSRAKVEFRPLRTSTASDSSDVLLQKRSKSAPPKTAIMNTFMNCKYKDESINEGSLFTLKTAWLEDLDTNKPRVQSAKVGNRNVPTSFFKSNAFQEIFKLYTEQSTPSYRPPAQPPVKSKAATLNAKGQFKNERPDTGNTKIKIQRFIRMRRAESLLKSLKSFKGHKFLPPPRREDEKSPTSPRRESLAAMDFFRRQRSDPSCTSEATRRRSELKPRVKSVSSEEGHCDENCITRGRHESGEGFNRRGRYTSVDVNMIGVHHT